MAVLTVTRYGQRYQFTHATVKSAALSACDFIDSNEAAPVSIEENEIAVWENTYPMDDSYDKLRDIAGLTDDA